MKNYKILVIDDAFFIRNLIKKAIIKKPLKNDSTFEIIGEAENGCEGLELCKKLNPDIITVDFNIPELNGLDFAKYLKEMNPRIPILMITSNTDPDFPKQVEDINCHFLQKPFQEAHLWMRLDILAAEYDNFDESKVENSISEKTKDLLKVISNEIEEELVDKDIILNEIKLPSIKKNNDETKSSINKKKKKKKNKNPLTSPINEDNILGLEFDDSITIKPIIHNKKTVENTENNKKKINNNEIIFETEDLLTKKVINSSPNEKVIIDEDNNLNNKSNNEIIIEEELIIEKDSINDEVEIIIEEKPITNDEVEIVIEEEPIFEDDSISINDEDEIIIEEESIIKDDSISINDEVEIIIEEEPMFEDDSISINDENEIIIEEESIFEDDSINIIDNEDNDNDNDDIIMIDEDDNEDDKYIEIDDIELSETEIKIKELLETVNYSYQEELSHYINAINRINTNEAIVVYGEQQIQNNETTKIDNSSSKPAIVDKKKTEDIEFEKLFAQFNPQLSDDVFIENNDEIEEIEEIKENIIHQSPNITKKIEIEPPRSKRVREIYNDDKEKEIHLLKFQEKNIKKENFFSKIFKLFSNKK